MIGFTVRIMLEMDAMFRGKSLAEEYIETTGIYTKEEIKQISKANEKVTSIGMKVVTFQLLLNVIIQVIVFLLIQGVRW